MPIDTIFFSWLGGQLGGAAVKSGGDEAKRGIQKFFSNRTAKKQTNEAVERAARRFVERYDNPQARTLVQDRYFYERGYVQEAILELLKHPFDRGSAETIRKVLASVMPAHSEDEHAEAARFFLECLLEELFGVEKFNDLLSLVHQHKLYELLEERLPAPPDIDDARRKYLDCLIEQHRYVNPRGIQQTARSVTLALDEVHVLLTAEGRTRTRFPIEAGPPFGRKPLDEFEDLSEERRFALAEIAGRVEKVALPETVRDRSHVVILGDPGAGKTTLLRFLALHFGREERKRKKTNTAAGVVRDKDGNEYGPTRLPIPVRISLFADAFRDKRTLTLREFLPTAFGDNGVSSDVLKRVFDRALDDGAAFVLLDGLDEIIDTGDRVQIAQRIENFVTNVHPGNRFLVTSRIAGYGQARLGGKFEEFTLRKLERAQIETFLNRWCVAVERFHTSEAPESVVQANARHEISAILNAVDHNPGVMELASNPLMLTVLALIHRNGKRLPSRRIELYDLAVKTLLEDWQLARGIDSKNIVRESEAMRLLAPLALWMHTHKPSGLAKTGEVKEKLAEYLAASRNLHPENEDIQNAVEDFLRRVGEHTGVFVEKAKGQFGFLHLTFEEYFTARELVRRTALAADRIHPHRHDPRWREAILLAIAYLSTNSPEDACDLIRAAILAQGDVAEARNFKPSEFEDVLHRDLLFAVRCLGDCDTTEPQFRAQTARAFLDVYFESPYPKLDEKMTTILQSLHGSDLEPEIVALLLAALKDADGDVRRVAAWASGKLPGATPEIVAGLLAALRDESVSVRSGAASALGNLHSASHDSVALLLAALRDESQDVRSGAAYALGKLQSASPDIVAGLLAALRDESFSVRSGAADALGKLQSASPDIVAGLLAALRDESEYVRSGAASALGKLQSASPDIVAGLLAALRDESQDVRSGAASALGKLQSASPDIVAGLLAALRDESEYVRSGAASALGKLQSASPDIVAGLLAALRDESEYVRSGAAYALGNLHSASPDIVAGLLAALRDESEYVRRGAASALGNLHSASPDIVAGLLAALKTKDVVTKCHTAHALAKLMNRFPSKFAEKRNEIRQIVRATLDESSKDSLFIGDEYYSGTRDALWEALWRMG